MISQMMTKGGLWRYGARFLAVIAIAGFFSIGAGPFSAVERAFAGSCDACKAQYNNCRIKRRGHPSCDRAYEACLRNCVRSGRR